MKPTLFILAAGMGSRYGGLKQLDGLGPNGETIMDYSVFDALRAGFGKVVFVIRKDFEEDFRNIVLSKYADHVQCEVCFQGIDNLPEGFTRNPERTKPWGTNHAVLMAKDIINEPFMVINADDFYGKESFEVMAKFLCILGQESLERFLCICEIFRSKAPHIHTYWSVKCNLYILAILAFVAYMTIFILNRSTLHNICQEVVCIGATYTTAHTTMLA